MKVNKKEEKTSNQQKTSVKKNKPKKKNMKIPAVTVAEEKTVSDATNTQTENEQISVSEVSTTNSEKETTGRDNAPEKNAEATLDFETEYENASSIPKIAQRNIDSVEMQTYLLLKKLSAPSSLDGYAYITKTIVMCTDHPELLNAMTKEFYPKLAEIFHKTPSQVERAIRHCITRILERADAKVLEDIFGLDSTGRGIPNKEFFCRILEYMKFYHFV